MKTVLCVALAFFLGAVMHVNASPKHMPTEDMPVRVIPLQQSNPEESARLFNKVSRMPMLAAKPVDGAPAAAPLNQGRILYGCRPNDCTEIPYQVALLTSDGYFCGGSLISQRLVLTAAHCISPGADYILVLAGHVCWASSPLIVSAARAIVHGDYDDDWLLNDVAVIDLGGNLPLSACVQPVDLETEGCGDESLVGKLAKVSGWGLTSDSSTAIEDCLWYAKAEIIPNSVCRTYYGGSIIDGTLCAVSAKGYNGTICSGDSGGPLVLKETGRQVGINSFVSIYGCEADWPNGYARVPCYIDWIRYAETL